MVKKFFLFMTVVMAVLLFQSCSYARGENHLKIEISPLDKNIADLVSPINDAKQLQEIANDYGTLGKLNAKYRIECIREDNGMYRVSYLGEDGVAVIWYGETGERLWGNVYKTQLLKNDFDGIKKGQTLDDVRMVDPNGEYLFLYAGRNDLPRKSVHYTKDGYCISIWYDNSNIISSMIEELL